MGSNTLGAAHLVAFVGVRDLTIAGHFYGDTLGLDLHDERPFALVARLGPAMLRITAVDQPAAGSYTVLGWGVENIEDVVEDLIRRGVTFTHYDNMGQDARGIWTAPNGAKVAWFLDPDGNNLSLTEF